jgi:hypothetical protein
MSQEYLIQIYSKPGELLKSAVWTDQEVFSFGHPLRWVLEKDEFGLKIRNLESSFVQQVQSSTSAVHLTPVGKALLVGIFPTRRNKLAQAWESTQVHSELGSLENYRDLFLRALSISVTVFVLTLTIATLVSHFAPHHEDVLIPPQFAKIIMSTPPTTSTRRNQTPQFSGGLRSTAVQSVTQNLIHGGALAALAGSHLSTPIDTHSLSKQIFGKNQTEMNLGNSNESSRKLQTTLSTLSGAGGKNGVAISGGDLNYGSVKGNLIGNQGHSFVSLEAPEAKVDDGLSQEEVGRVIHSHLSEVRYCYESTLLKISDLQGKLVIDFLILPDGAVQNAKLNQSSVNDSSLAHCLVSKLMNWKFPKPKGGAEVAVSYPFIFKTLGK